MVIDSARWRPSMWSSIVPAALHVPIPLLFSLILPIHLQFISFMLSLTCSFRCAGSKSQLGRFEKIYYYPAVQENHADAFSKSEVINFRFLSYHRAHSLPQRHLHLLTLGDQSCQRLKLPVPIDMLDVVVGPPRLLTSRTEQRNIVHSTVITKHLCRDLGEILV